MKRHLQARLERKPAGFERTLQEARARTLLGFGYLLTAELFHRTPDGDWDDSAQDWLMLAATHGPSKIAVDRFARAEIEREARFFCGRPSLASLLSNVRGL